MEDRDALRMSVSVGHYVGGSHPTRLVVIGCEIEKLPSELLHGMNRNCMQYTRRICICIRIARLPCRPIARSGG